MMALPPTCNLFAAKVLVLMPLQALLFLQEGINNETWDSGDQGGNSLLRSLPCSGWWYKERKTLRIAYYFLLLQAVPLFCSIRKNSSANTAQWNSFLFACFATYTSEMVLCFLFNFLSKAATVLLWKWYASFIYYAEGPPCVFCAKGAVISQ